MTAFSGISGSASQFPEPLRSGLFLTALFLIFFEHLVLAIPLTWLRGRNLALSLAAVIFTLFLMLVFSRLFLPPVWKHHLKAQGLYLRGQYEDGEVEALKALELNPLFYRTYIDLGNIYDMRGEYIKARECYLLALRFLRAHPRNLGLAYFNLGGVYLREMDPANAWVSYRKAYEINSKFGYEPSWWPRDPGNPGYYVWKNDARGFRKAASSGKMPYGVSQRIGRLNANLSKGLAKEVFRESLKYLEENKGTVYRAHFLALMDEALRKIHPDDSDYSSFHKAHQAIKAEPYERQGAA